MSATIEIQLYEYKCPTCGFVTKDGPMSTRCTIQVSIEPYAGEYCMRCYAQWISENVPQMGRREL